MAAINLTHSAFIYVCAMYIIIRSFFVVVIGVVSWDGDYCFLIFVCNALVKWILWIFIVVGRGEGGWRGVDEDNS